MDPIDDLEAEQDRLDSILERLDESAWLAPSGAAGWSVADVLLHLAQTEEAVVASARQQPGASPLARAGGESVDGMAARAVAEQRAEPAAIFRRWQEARRASVAALRAADPDVRLVWVAAPLKPATLATTRLAEHWAHGLDITEPLGIAFPDTERLRHIAWLGHSTLPYAFAVEGLEPQPIRCELIGPTGSVWHFGAADAPSVISGGGGAFCRVGARRLSPAAAGLTTRGPHARAALGVLRNYAA